MKNRFRATMKPSTIQKRSSSNTK